MSNQNNKTESEFEEAIGRAMQHATIEGLSLPSIIGHLRFQLRVLELQQDGSIQNQLMQNQMQQSRQQAGVRGNGVIDVPSQTNQAGDPAANQGMPKDLGGSEA